LRHNGGLRNTSPAFLPRIDRISLKIPSLNYKIPIYSQVTLP
jgi:hypothetical protein